MLEGLTCIESHYSRITERYPRFAYIDRVAVAPRHRGRGSGTRLYDAAVAGLAGRRNDLLCEVNLAPSNPASLQFHRRNGFRPVGELWNDDRSRGVVFMTLSLSAGAAG